MGMNIAEYVSWTSNRAPLANTNFCRGTTEFITAVSPAKHSALRLTPSIPPLASRLRGEGSPGSAWLKTPWKTAFPWGCQDAELAPNPQPSLFPQRTWNNTVQQQKTTPWNPPLFKYRQHPGDKPLGSGRLTSGCIWYSCERVLLKYFTTTVQTWLVVSSVWTRSNLIKIQLIQRSKYFNKLSVELRASWPLNCDSLA